MPTDMRAGASERDSAAFPHSVPKDLLRAQLRALLARSGAPTRRVLSLRSGVPERTISRILYGHDRTTRFDIADALLTALDNLDTWDLDPAAEGAGSDVSPGV